MEMTVYMHITRSISKDNSADGVLAVRSALQLSGSTPTAGRPLYRFNEGSVVPLLPASD